MDDCLNALTTTTPFGLYDREVPCDGAAAVVVSSVATAKDMPHRPVLFEAVGTQVVERTDWDQSTQTHQRQLLGQAAHLCTAIAGDRVTPLTTHGNLLSHGGLTPSGAILMRTDE